MKILALPITFSGGTDKPGTKPLFTVEFTGGKVVQKDAEELLGEYDLTKVVEDNAPDFLAALANDIRGAGVRVMRVRVPAQPRSGFDMRQFAKH